MLAENMQSWVLEHSTQHFCLQRAVWRSEAVETLETMVEQ
jgi:hypothetical protein